jgi:hypothetical protein
MALSVTEERHITQVSWESPWIEPAVLPCMRSRCCGSGRGRGTSWRVNDELIPSGVRLGQPKVSRLRSKRSLFAQHSPFPLAARVQRRVIYCRPLSAHCCIFSALHAPLCHQTHHFALYPTLITRHASNLDQACRRRAKWKGYIPHCNCAKEVVMRRQRATCRVRSQGNPHLRL